MPALRIAVVSAPNGTSAIAAYSTRLVEALGAAGADAKQIEHGDWSARGIRAILTRLRRGRFDVVHYQFPSTAFGRRGGIQLVSVLHPGVTTLHEATRFGPVRGRLRLLPFTLRSRAVVLTTPYERDYIAGFAPWARRRTAVIPIGNNIQVAPRGDPPKREIVYFGHIRPNKGIEAFLDLASTWAASGDPTPFRLVGVTTPAYGPYAAGLWQSAGRPNVTWISDLHDDATAAARLAQAAAAYLPFPDGVSARRGSFLALAGNGVPVVTTGGRQTTAELRSAAVIVNSPAEATTALRRLLDDPAYAAETGARGRAYAAQFAWERIALQHIALYGRIVGRR